MTAAYTISDVGSDILCTEHEPSLSLAKDDEGFKNDWVYLTVENEVTRGKKLRTEKPTTSRRNREYDVLNINFPMPYCNEIPKRRRTNRRKKYKRGTSPCLPKPKLSPRCTSGAQVLKEFNHRTKVKHLKRCTMRLAELAVPTKRQCIDVWRNKSYVLPALMVERLQQYVMDQRPIVQIPDALYCFQRRKSLSSKKSSKNKLCKCKTLNIPLRKTEAKALCAIFGHKISNALRNPLNLSLGSNLDTISQVVAVDIAHIMYGRKNANEANFINLPIHTEMSNKVTIWILNILEDASYKMLLEEMRDLEEEEGPALDFIDDLVDNVVTICDPCPVQYESSSESSCTDKNNVTEEQSEINITSDTKSDIHELDDNELTDAEYFKNEIKYIINNFDKTSQDEQENENIEITLNVEEINENINEIEENIDETNENIEEMNENIEEMNENIEEINENIEEIIENFDDRGIYEKKENQEQNYTDIEGNLNEYTNKIDNDNNDANQVNLELENPESTDLEIMENIDATENNISNVSEVFEIFSEELLDDDKNKKVKFSRIDMVNLDESELFTVAETGHNLSEENLYHEQEQVSWKSYSGHIFNIIFAEPNEHLLSDADEIWPKALPSPTLKASESVSKSITSLGNITETDEKNVTPPETEQRRYVVIKNIKDLVPSHKEMIGDSDENNLWTKKFSASNILKEYFKTESNKTLQTMIDTKKSEEKLNEESKLFKDDIHTDVKDINSNLKNIDDNYYTIIEEVATEKQAQHDITEYSAEPMDVWRVHPESMPSWVILARVDPSEIPIPNTTTPIRDCDIREWCKHLAEGFKKMESWASWIDQIDKDINHLKNRKEFCAKCSCMKRKHSADWTKLMKYVDSDTVLWRNVFRGSKQKLKSFRRFYHCNRIEVTPTLYCACKCTCKY